MLLSSSKERRLHLIEIISANEEHFALSLCLLELRGIAKQYLMLCITKEILIIATTELKVMGNAISRGLAQEPRLSILCYNGGHWKHPAV